MSMQDMKDRMREAKEQRLQAQAAKHDSLIDKVGLDVSAYSDEQLRAKNAESIGKIRTDMRGNGLEKLSLTFGGNAKDRAMLGYLSALTEQNWILMRQNELIINALDKLAGE